VPLEEVRRVLQQLADHLADARQLLPRREPVGAALGLGLLELLVQPETRIMKNSSRLEK
jgi:hypothetical protein